MATISTSIKLVDGMSPVLRAANTSLKALLKTWDSASVKFSKGLGGKGAVVNINADLAGVVNKLSTIENGINRVNQNIRKTHRGLGHVVNQGVHANTTLNNMGKILDASTNKQGRLAVATSRVRSAINANKLAQDEHNKSIQRGESFMTNLYRKVRNIAMVYGGIQGGLKVLGTADELTRTEARFNLMTGNDKAATAALQESTYQSAMRSRSDYLGTASTVAKLGQRAPGLFASNDDTVQFVENLNKAYKIAGATEQEMWASTLQLSQGLGAGALRGEEFRSVFEAAPNLIRIIAEEMGQPVGKMKDLAAEGKLTSEVIRDALLNATDKINRDFANLPYTWADVWITFSNITLRAAQPILKTISKITSSQRFIKFSAGVERAIKWLINIFQDLLRAVKPVLIDIYDALEDVYNFIGSKWSFFTSVIQSIIRILGELASTLVSKVVSAIATVSGWMKTAYGWIKSIGNFFKNNWSSIASIIFGVTTAFLAYKGALFVSWLWSKKMIAVTALKTAAMLAWKAALLVAKGVVMAYHAVLAALRLTILAIKNAFYVTTIAQWAWNAAVSIGQGIVTAYKTVLAALRTGITLTTVAQWALTASFLVIPAIILIVIGLIYIIVAAYNLWTGESVSATGIIVGAAYAVWEAIQNVGIWATEIWDYACNWIKSKWQWLKDTATVIGENIGIAFSKAFNTAKSAVASFVLFALEQLRPLAAAIDRLPKKMGGGLNLAGFVDRVIASANKMKADADKGKGESFKDLPDWSKYNNAKWNPKYGSLSAAYDRGYSVGEKFETDTINTIESSVKELFGKFKDKFSGVDLDDMIPEKLKSLIDKFNKTNDTLGGTESENLLGGSGNDGNKAANDTNKALNGIGKDVKGISNSLDVSEDERKYLYTIAEREAINQMTRNEIKVTMTNNNTMNNGTDAKGTMDYLARQLLNQVQSSQEGLAY